MKYQFFYVDFTEETINNKKYLCINFLEKNRKVFYKIYKVYSEDIKNNLVLFSVFEDITSLVDFVIKRDGKVSLDINFD